MTFCKIAPYINSLNYLLTLYSIGGRVDSVFDSCLTGMGSNPAEVGHYVATVG